MTRTHLCFTLAALLAACTESAPPPPDRPADAGARGDAGSIPDAGAPEVPELCPPSAPFGTEAGIVQQFGMSGSRSLFPEIARRINNSPSEMMLPDAIDDHAGCQWIVRARDCIGQLPATTFTGVV